MDVSGKTLAAIAGAIGLYLEGEERLAERAPGEERGPQPSRAVFSPWVLAGRQSAMEMRQMFQRRLFR
jgi:hypothetical protein